MTPFIDFSGLRFGKLVVIKYSGLNKSQKRLWLCKCDCGNEKVVLAASLKSGKTISCNCVARDLLIKRNFKHGNTIKGNVSAEYRTWTGLIQRCTNEKNTRFKEYGGSGIGVCKRWLNSFDNFLKDMGQRPTNLHSIDRINGLKGYTPLNCRWATKKEQKENQKVTIWLEYNGIKLTQRGWAQRWGVQDSVIAGHRKRGKIFSEIYNYFESGNSKKAKFYS